MTQISHYIITIYTLVLKSGMHISYLPCSWYHGQRAMGYEHNKPPEYVKFIEKYLNKKGS